MCRFLAYKGLPILMDEILYAPKHSLIRQSYKAHESDEPLNGDGFGIGWYAPDIDTTPAVFRSVRPAWGDANLRNIAPKIRSGCFFAHVRAASTGEVAEANCHPFAYKNYLFMHNGNIDGFDKIKRLLRRNLSDRAYEWIRGQTDSEHFFALLIDRLDGEPDLVKALGAAVADVAAMKKEAGVTEPSTINVTISDGQNLVAMRYVSTKEEKPLTLYYAVGSRYECRDGITHMLPADGAPRAVLVVSEKLTGRKGDWIEVEPNTMVIVDPAFAIRVQPV